MTIAEIKALSVLCRIALSDKQIQELKSDFESILGYVDQLSEVQVTATPTKHITTNQFREDQNPHDSGAYFEALLAEAPIEKGGYVQVQKILGGNGE